MKNTVWKILDALSCGMSTKEKIYNSLEQITELIEGLDDYLDDRGNVTVKKADVLALLRG